MIKVSMFTAALILSSFLSLSVSAAQDTCTLNFKTGVAAFVDETSNLPFYVKSKNFEEKLQIEAFLLASGSNAMTIMGGCEHISVSFRYSVDPSLASEQDTQNALAKGEQLLRETPLTEFGVLYADYFLSGIEKAKKSPSVIAPGKINLATGPDAEVVLDYSTRGALVFTYFFSL